ncbi:MAG: ABC transporter permease [Ruminococcus sp.]|nr:ABC transporter permease [Ruminococcus sp.]
MQVFKAFFKVLKRNSFTAIVFIGVFLLLALMISDGKAEVTIFALDAKKVSVFDEDDSPESRKFVEMLGEKFEIVDIRNDRDIITDMLYYEQIDYAFVINRGWSEKLAAGETDGLFTSYKMHDSYAKVIVEQCLDDYVTAVNVYTAAGMSLDKAMDCAGEDILVETDVTIEKFGDDNKDFTPMFAAYYRYLPYIFISAILSALCPVLMIMNRKDIRFRTNCSSVDANSYTMQIFAGGAVFVLAVWLIFIGAGVYMYGGIFRGKAWTALLNSGLFALITTALAVLVASVIDSQKILTLIVQILGLGMSFLCGIFVPQSMLGDSVNAVGRFLPAYWYVRLNEMLCGDRLYSTGKAMACLLIEAAYAVTLVLVTVLIRRVRYSGAHKMTAAKA